MLSYKEKIKDNLEFLAEQQLLELAEFSTFLKIRSKIHNSNKNNISSFKEFADRDKDFAESGIAEYNSDLLKEDEL